MYHYLFKYEENDKTKQNTPVTPMRGYLGISSMQRYSEPEIFRGHVSVIIVYVKRQKDQGKWVLYKVT